MSRFDHDKRARELVRLKKRIGHSFAFWLHENIYATKQGAKIRVFHTYGNSKASNGRLICETAAEPMAAYLEIAEAIDRQLAAQTAHTAASSDETATA